MPLSACRRIAVRYWELVPFTSIVGAIVLFAIFFIAIWIIWEVRVAKRHIDFIRKSNANLDADEEVSDMTYLIQPKTTEQEMAVSPKKRKHMKNDSVEVRREGQAGGGSDLSA